MVSKFTPLSWVLSKLGSIMGMQSSDTLTKQSHISNPFTGCILKMVSQGRGLHSVERFWAHRCLNTEDIKCGAFVHQTMLCGSPRTEEPVYGLQVFALGSHVLF